MDLGLRGKVALVTGASKGIGRAIALGLAREGASVAISARTQADLAEAERAFLRQQRPNIVLGRAGTAEETAAAVVFLASEAASFITGANYRVDGGSIASI